jgi:filamentous hemagglutinin
MNKTYRLVWNKNSQMWIPVSELAKSNGKRSSRRLTIGALLISSSMSLFAADIVADPNQPNIVNINQATNGVAIVNINNANAAGVSHNLFQKFDVPKIGAVLNNSNSTTTTALAGTVSGNSSLTVPARVIINEVTQNNPSNLLGYTEIAGNKADLIIANPYGINCNTCGFLNASKVTLTTGQTLFDANGRESGFKIEGGQIVFAGQDINLTNIDAFSVISRSIDLQRSLLGKKIDLVTGVGKFDADGNITEQDISPDDKPEFAISSAVLGGVYGDSIRMIATEKGVGVNLQGGVSTKAGDLSISSDGTLRSRQLDAKNIELSSKKDIIIQDFASADEQLTIQANGSIQVEGGLAAGKKADLSGHDINISPTGHIYGGVDRNNEYHDQSGLVLSASGSIDNKGEVISLGDINIATDGLFSNLGVIQSADSTNLTAKNIENNKGLIGASNINLKTIDGLYNSGILAADLSIDMISKDFINDGGNVSASQLSINLSGLMVNQKDTAGNGKIIADQLNLSAFDLTNATDITVLGSATLLINVDHQFINSSTGVIETNADQLTIKSQRIDVAGTIKQTGSNGIHLIGDQTIAISQGTVLSASAIDFESDKVDVKQGLLSAGDTISMSGQNIDIDGQISAGSLVAISADQNLTIDHSEISSGQSIDINGKNTITVKNSRIDAKQIDAATLGNFRIEKSQLVSNQHTGLSGSTLNLIGSQIQSDQIGLTASQDINQTSLADANAVIRAQKIQVTAGGDYDNTGTIEALSTDQDSLTFAVNGVVNNHNQGIIASYAKNWAPTLSLVNTNALFLAEGQGVFDLSNIDLLSNAKGTIQSNDSIFLDTDHDFYNQFGLVAAKNDIEFSIGDTLNNKSGAVVGNHINIDAANLANNQGLLRSLSFTLNTDHLNNSQGEISANDIDAPISSIHATTLENTGGLIYSAGLALDLSGQNFTQTNGAVIVDGGVLQQGELNFDFSESIKSLSDTNATIKNAVSGEASSLIQSSQHVAVQTNQLVNQGELIAVSGDTDLNVKDSIQNTGIIHAGHLVQLESSGLLSLTNNGKIYSDSADQLDWSLDRIDNQQGLIVINSDQLNIDLLAVENSLFNDHGTLVHQGTGIFNFDLYELNNDSGVIASNHDLKLTMKASIEEVNLGPTLDPNINLDDLQNDNIDYLYLGGGSISNQQGLISANHDLSVSAINLNNKTGAIYSGNDLNIDRNYRFHHGIFNNEDGLIQSENNINIQWMSANYRSYTIPGERLYGETSFQLFECLFENKDECRNENFSTGNIIAGSNLDLISKDVVITGAFQAKDQINLKIETLGQDFTKGDFNTKSNVNITNYEINDYSKNTYKPFSNTIKINADIHAGGSITIDSAENLFMAGQLTSAQDIQLTAPRVALGVEISKVDWHDDVLIPVYGVNNDESFNNDTSYLFSKNNNDGNIAFSEKDIHINTEDLTISNSERVIGDDITIVADSTQDFYGNGIKNDGEILALNNISIHA